MKKWSQVILLIGSVIIVLTIVSYKPIFLPFLKFDNRSPNNESKKLGIFLFPSEISQAVNTEFYLSEKIFIPDGKKFTSGAFAIHFDQTHVALQSVEPNTPFTDTVKIQKTTSIDIANRDTGTITVFVEAKNAFFAPSGAAGVLRLKFRILKNASSQISVLQKQSQGIYLNGEEAELHVEWATNVHDQTTPTIIHADPVDLKLPTLPPSRESPTTTQVPPTTTLLPMTPTSSVPSISPTPREILITLAPSPTKAH